jgi:DNA-binding IclR family transcriptional regulator
MKDTRQRASDIIFANMEPGEFYQANTLAEATGYSPRTARIALNGMQKQGLVRRVPGHFRQETKFMNGNKPRIIRVDGWYKVTQETT